MRNDAAAGDTGLAALIQHPGYAAQNTQHCKQECPGQGDLRGGKEWGGKEWGDWWNGVMDCAFGKQQRSNVQLNSVTRFIRPSFSVRLRDCCNAGSLLLQCNAV